MNSKGIFDSGSTDPADQPAPSPFGVVSDDSAEVPPNPFAAASPQPSPFSIAGQSDATEDRPQLEPGKPARLPEKRPQASEASPFSLAEPSEGFGYEPSSPFGGGASFESAPSPFAAAPAEQAAAPPEEPAPVPAPVPAMRSEPAAPAAPAPVAPVAPPVDPAPAAEIEPTPAWAAAPPAAAVAATTATAASVGSAQPEIRQLALRAIFGVDRELSADEIIQRLRGLAGVRHAVRVGPGELGAMEMLRGSLSGMASESTPLKLSIGGSPVDFIREGEAVLAVMTDGSFAPGVRETMIIAARELNKMM